MNFIEKNYKIGSTIEVPHPHIGEGTKQAKVINHTIDISHPFQKGPTGIMVQFEDGIYIEVDAGYLNEDGGGVV